MASKEITIKLIKSPIGRVKRHRACVRGLGLRRLHHQVTVADTPENRGMINKIVDMLAIQES
ncbi:50S ribosomal protein L30 [Salinisphaera sp. C84B14]|uniref:50S ribosomal protein L30 n=1 Tax=unclassified Salinisphaera TaxID=2649847 RepID=UPI000C45550A|nr:50S ribosomal protein L30 [Salinisphaera sp.]MBS63345.1 50S ribosomal protein L30 [Salinisphaera sp.]|tara:strand:- start:552 stop:737 length:186 start_codon:yes stop_codon:yes gene_type:complete